MIPTGGGIFKSTNGGANWSIVNTGLPSYPMVDALAIDPATPNILYARTWAGVFKSTNGGENWNAANTGLPTTVTVYLGQGALAIDPVTPSTLYVGTDAGVFKSTNSGGNWSAVNTGLPPNTYVHSLAINPLMPTTLYAGTDVGVFKSANSGGSWSDVNDFQPIYKDIFALAIDPATPTTLYAGTSYGVFKSTDNGENWNDFSTGLTHTNVLALAINPATPNILYAGTDGGVATSHDTAALSILHSQGSYDGHIFELGENSNAGWRFNSNSSRLYVGDDHRNRQYLSILSFDTSSLPDNAVIFSAILHVKRMRIIGKNPFDTHGNLEVEIGSPCFGSSCNLETADFQAGAQDVAGNLSSSSTNEWHSIVIDQGDYSYINLTGTTQFRLRFELEDNNDRSADGIQFLSGNANMNDRPVLIIEYYVP